MSYLYYLPFSMLFTSSDNLHRRTAPLFLREDQSFVYGPELKAALKELDAHYDQLPEEVKALGVMAFANFPPPELDNLVVELWDKHMRPSWRSDAKSPEEILARRQAAPDDSAAAELSARMEAAQPAADTDLGDEEPDYVVIRRRVPVQKGKWRLVPEGLENADSNSADSTA